MKLAFSTLGTPGLPLPDALRLARTHGYHGIELRAHPEEPVHPGLSGAERARAAGQFEEAGVEVVGIAGYPRVAAPGADGPVLDEIRELLGLARDLGAPFVRVFPGGGSGQSAGEADAAAVRRLACAAPQAAELGVRILLETHDSHREGAAVGRVLEAVGHQGTGALWDVMHTWLGGEQPDVSFGALSPYLGYVQVKDIATAEDTAPLALGAGVLPLTECVEVLSRRGWDGWLCWEYEKRWYPQAAELSGLLGAGREHLCRLLDEAA
ncbi:sugar phosphate isomerase/epimerase family protein [Streptomyces sp. KLOTTS4A1]|uniref:sugar phosphate isomerase/epimerase family protein n=1 Tax=Streptomyces sp. KLOTTS4A1 TaxID=3390996 RepID=UPI0039F554E5